MNYRSNAGLCQPTPLQGSILDIRELGLSLVGFGTMRQQVSDKLNTDRFRAFYGVSPKALESLFICLQDKFGESSAKLEDFLMTMNWLKSYDTEHVLAGRWGLSEQTIRTKVQIVTGRIQSLKTVKVII